MDEARTRDNQFGKLRLYQLSYHRTGRLKHYHYATPANISSAFATNVSLHFSHIPCDMAGGASYFSFGTTEASTLMVPRSVPHQPHTFFISTFFVSLMGLHSSFSALYYSMKLLESPTGVEPATYTFGYLRRSKAFLNDFAS